MRKKNLTGKKKFRRKKIWSRNLFLEKNSEQKRFLAFSGGDLVKFFYKKMTEKKIWREKKILSKKNLVEKFVLRKKFWTKKVLAFSGGDLVKFCLKKYDRKKNLTGKKNFVEKNFGQEICSQKKNLNKKCFWPLAVGTLPKNFFGRFYITSSYFGLGENFRPIFTFFQVLGIL